MSLDLIILFAIMVALVAYLIYSRAQYEKEVVSIYEQKFQQWKEHGAKEEKSCKELVALVYEQDYKLTIEMLNNNCIQRLEAKKFEIKEA